MMTFKYDLSPALIYATIYTVVMMVADPAYFETAWDAVSLFFAMVGGWTMGSYVGHLIDRGIIGAYNR